MKIAWLSNAPHAQSGYAYQTEMFVRLLKRAGHDVICITNSEFRDGPQLVIDNLVYFPGGRGQGMEMRFGWEGAMALSVAWKPDVVFSLFDIWTYPKDLGKQIEKAGSVWAPICPVDHDPLPPPVWEVLKSARYPIAMSRFGLAKMQEAKIENASYIPHGVDTSIFRPYPQNEEVRGKLSNGNPDKFIVGIVAANQSSYDRKAWDETIQVWARFHAKHPDTVLYVHAILNEYGGGMPIRDMAQLNGVEIIGPDRWQYMNGFTTEQLATIMNGFDVHMLISRGEGFGIPTIEAQACGVPVITHKVCAQADLNGSGWEVKPERRVFQQQSWQFLPDIDDATDKLCIAYRLWKNGGLLPYKARARAFSVYYDIGRVFGLHMLPFLEKVQRENALRKVEDDGKLQKEVGNIEEHPKADERDKRSGEAA